METRREDRRTRSSRSRRGVRACLGATRQASSASASRGSSRLVAPKGMFDGETCGGVRAGSGASTPDNYPPRHTTAERLNHGGAGECVKFILMIMIMAGTSDLLPGGASYVTRHLFRKVPRERRPCKSGPEMRDIPGPA